MTFIILIVLVILHWLGIKKIGEKLEGNLGVSQFKAKTLLVPLDIGISALFIWLTPLSFPEAGLALGKYVPGLRSLLIIGVPYAVLTSVLVILLPEDELDSVEYGEKESFWGLVYVWAFVGPVEELFYRGFIQGTLSGLLDGKIFFLSYATLISSIIFVIVHAFNVLEGNETWGAFLSTLPTRLLAALVLGYSLQVSNSIIYPILIHNIIDGLNFSALLYRKKA